jgi:hypothetical protein
VDCRPNFLHWRIDAPNGGKAVFDSPQAASMISILLEILSDAHRTCHHRQNGNAFPSADIASSHLQQLAGQLEAAGQCTSADGQGLHLRHIWPTAA